MTRTTVTIIVGVLWCSSVGCGRPPALDLSAALKESRSNVIQSYEKHHDNSYLVSGTVEKFGILNVGDIKTKTQAYPFFPVVTISARRVYYRFGYAILRPVESSEKGFVFCYFEPRKRSDAGLLTKGKKATLEGVFDNIIERDGHIFLIFQECETVFY